MIAYLLFATIAWYIIFEFVLWQMRRHGGFPTTATFALGLLQTGGAFLLGVSAAVALFFK
ncbi:hypothetical protein [Chitinimonas lacunae]|uniref:Uncharacterized protein n=1 Tax=Chitinimonas lacunae TaxID=1963018 RepID=A0ABV8MKY7_9NEIS